jgi:hypothetical protein
MDKEKQDSKIAFHQCQCNHDYAGATLTAGISKPTGTLPSGCQTLAGVSMVLAGRTERNVKTPSPRAKSSSFWAELDSSGPGHL